MHCHQCQNMVAGSAVGLIALYGASALVKNKPVRLALLALAVIASVVVFFIPGGICPLCMMKTMRCHTVFQPFVRIMSVLVAGSGVGALVASVQEGPEALRLTYRPDRRQWRREGPIDVREPCALARFSSCSPSLSFSTIVVRNAMRYREAVALDEAGDTPGAYEIFRCARGATRRGAARGGPRRKTIRRCRTGAASKGDRDRLRLLRAGRERRERARADSVDRARAFDDRSCSSAPTCSRPASTTTCLSRTSRGQTPICARG